MGHQMILCGIDPGKQGAFALLDSETGGVTCFDMPDTTAALHELVSSFPLIKRAIVEKPYYPAINGTANAGRKGEDYGKLIGALAWCDIPVREVTPKTWKAAMNLSASKSASRELAGQSFPDYAAQWKLAKWEGRAEAALIALYGMGLR